MTNGMKLNLGSNLYHWSPKKWRDFYFKMAEESCFDEIHVGEVVCAKRIPTFQPFIMEVLDRIKACGKTPVLSTLALIISNGEINLTKKLVEKAIEEKIKLEANDISILNLLDGAEHQIGYFVNTYSELTFNFLAKNGASSICLPPELPRESIKVISRQKSSDTEIEVMVFGRLPLAISARCYHARHYDLKKEECQLVCHKDPEGMKIETVDYEEFLVINGLQTQSYTYANLMSEIPDLKHLGVNSFRVAIQDCDMIKVGQEFRKVMNEEISTNEGLANLKEICDIPFSNGFYYGIEGHKNKFSDDI